MINRRSFLKQATLASAGLMVSPSLIYSEELKVKRVGLQLYTLRDYIGKDVVGVIQQVAKSGYSYVETYGYSINDKFWGLDAKSFSMLLKDNGLSTPSGHYGMDLYLGSGKEDDLKSYIEAANIIGQEFVTVPWLDESFRKNADDYKKVADKLNKAGELCRKANLKLAYHNHDFEFKQLDNGIGYDIILNNTEPKLVSLELDLYWVVRAGYDPVALFKKHPHRFVMWHIKDMDKNDPTLNTEVGNGSIDFSTIFANQKVAGIEYIFMEQENNYVPDVFGSIKKSRSYISTKLV